MYRARIPRWYGIFSWVGTIILVGAIFSLAIQFIAKTIANPIARNWLISNFTQHTPALIGHIQLDNWRILIIVIRLGEDEWVRVQPFDFIIIVNRHIH